MNVEVRWQKLDQDQEGHTVWTERIKQAAFQPEQTGVLVCDMWDSHWSRGAAERCAAMTPRMNDVLTALRGQGMTIFHCPSDTMDAYAGHPGRLRAMAAPEVALPAESGPDCPMPALPVDATDGGSDTGELDEHRVWTCQHPAILIDPDRDIISDIGREILNVAAARGITRFLIMGVHTNMCVLLRSFAIVQMVRWNKPIFLVRDLTDAMYNPARPPYVSHDEGTSLVIAYIEKFWCPTVESSQFLEKRSVRIHHNQEMP